MNLRRNVIGYDNNNQVCHPLTICNTTAEYNLLLSQLLSKKVRVVTYTYYPDGTVCKSQHFPTP